MIDVQINKVIKPVLDLFAKKLLRYNVKANLVTFTGFFFGLF